MTYLITFVGTVAAIIGIWLFVKPRVSVISGEALDPNNPVFSTFVVRNDGHLAIRDVKISNSINTIFETEKNVLIVGPGDYSDSFTIKEQFADVIDPGEEYSIELAFSQLKHPQFGYMDIAFKISFRPHKWWRWRHNILRRFVSKKRKDGQWCWFPMPIEKKIDRFKVNVPKNSNEVDKKR